MQETSFGQMDKLLKIDGKDKAEYLVFTKEGRGHKHREYESFTVLSGSGQVISGDKTYQVKPGDIVTIPPMTEHRMVPTQGETLTGLLWYHDVPTNHLSH